MGSTHLFCDRILGTISLHILYEFKNKKSMAFKGEILPFQMTMKMHASPPHDSLASWMTREFNETTVGKQNPSTAEKLTSVVLTYLLGRPSSCSNYEEWTWVRLDVAGTRRVSDEFRRLFSSLAQQAYAQMAAIWNTVIFISFIPAS